MSRDVGGRLKTEVGFTLQSWKIEDQLRVLNLSLHSAICPLHWNGPANQSLSRSSSRDALEFVDASRSRTNSVSRIMARKLLDKIGVASRVRSCRKRKSPLHFPKKCSWEVEPTYSWSPTSTGSRVGIGGLTETASRPQLLKNG